MAGERALLSESEREVLKRSLEDSERAELLPKLTKRISDELPQDLAILKQHEPVLYDTVVDQVETSIVEHPWGDKDESGF